MKPSRKKGRIVILISGRGTNMVRLVEASQAGDFHASVVLVVSNNPKAGGLEKAARLGIPTVCLPSSTFENRSDFDRMLIDIIRDARPDLICLAGFMRILSTSFIQAFRNRIMNIHPALLPAFPGLHAQRQALKYGVKISGCTVHFIDEGVDTGPIILQKGVPVLENDTESDLADRILEKEHEAYPEAVKLFFENRLAVRGRRVFILDEPLPNETVS